jgi:hypothetical protein
MHMHLFQTFEVIDLLFSLDRTSTCNLVSEIGHSAQYVRKPQVHTCAYICPYICTSLLEHRQLDGSFGLLALLCRKPPTTLCSN